MAQPARKSAASDKTKRPTVDQLSGRSYAVFTDGGMRVDLKAYFSSKDGQAALVRLSSKKKR